MIVVANTKELEENYDLEQLRDDEQIIVQGGLKGKGKYNREHYINRVTYDARTLKQIIQQMKKIESQIPEEWNEFQRAKYIYTILAKNIEYEKDESKYKSGNCSNLKGLITGKAICAGYSLIFKEMMDRQGIQCDYIRGIAGKGEGKHAWNILTIDGKSFPIDITWDSCRINRGENGLEYFCDNPSFFIDHENDSDEKEYIYFQLSKKEVESIDISTKRQKSEQKFEISKKDAIDYAIDKTYMKLLRIYGKEKASRIMMANVRKYVTEKSEAAFTREKGAREVISKNVTVEDAIGVFSENYVERCMQKERHNIIEKAIWTTAQKYNALNASKALERYLKTGITSGFTRDGNARNDMIYNMDKDRALDTIIYDYVDERVMQIHNLNTTQQGYFSADEFELVNLPENKKANIIKSALAWIKGITRKVFNEKQGKENKNIEKEENRRQEGR